MVDVAQLSLLTVLVVILSNAEGRFDRRALGITITAVAAYVVADGVFNAPQVVLQAVSVVGVVVVVATFLAVVVHRSRSGDDRPA